MYDINQSIIRKARKRWVFHIRKNKEEMMEYVTNQLKYYPHHTD